MEENGKQTDGNKKPTGTDGQAPAANQSKGKPAATVDPSKVDLPDGYELIRSEDIKRFKSDGDRAKEENRQIHGALSGLLQKEAVRDAMADPEFKQKFPDVSQDDLLEADPGSEEEIMKIAEAKQTRYEKIKLDHVKKVQVAEAPTIAASDKDQQMKELSKPSGKSRFQQALKLTRMKTI